MPVTNDQKLMFLKAVYDQSRGDLACSLNARDIGEGLGWGWDVTTFAVFERLGDDGYWDNCTIGMSFTLSHEGLKLCEEAFGPPPERPINRLRFLRALYEDTDGSTSGMASAHALATHLGLDEDETLGIVTYWENEGFVEWLGAMVSLTRYGVEYVEEELHDMPSLEEAVAHGHEDTGLPLPHTDKQEYAFFAVDIVDHSRIVKDERTEDANAALDGFHDYVLQECGKRMGYELSWGGDGGLCCFHGQNCQVRAAQRWNVNPTAPHGVPASDSHSQGSKNMRTHSRPAGHWRHISTCLAITLALIGTTALATHAALPDAEAMARQILSATGVKGGLIVHLGCGDGKLTAALRANDSYLVHGLDADAANVRRARAYIRPLGIYGKAWVEQWDSSRLPYAENFVNLLVAEDLGNVSMDEVMRVLTPNGVAYTKERGKWTKTVKPWPDDIDEWTHHLHGPDGNSVANDKIVGPPKHYQWVAGPLWLRSHDTDSTVSAAVSAQGRIFYIIDEAPISLTGDYAPPDKWFLEARDAFNGIPLWQVPIEKWGWREWKDTWYASRPDNLPVNLPRRLVAVGDSVYATLGYHAPVSELDAATGKVLRTYEGTEDTREILCCKGVLILSVYREGRLKVMAIEANTAQVLWETAQTYAGSSREYFAKWQRRGEKGLTSRESLTVDPALNPAADGNVVCFIDGQDIVCLDFAAGGELWRTKVEEKESASSVGTMIVHDGVVLHAKRHELLALSAKTGKKLWSQPKRELGWLWFQWKDVFVINGLVWTWGTEVEHREIKQGRKTYRLARPLQLDAFDLRTGERRRQVSLGSTFEAPHHHRCYRNKATARYILASRRGTEFLDLETGKHSVNNWVRGTCHLGMMPANGLHYALPHPCVCYGNEKLNGFSVLAPEVPARYRESRREEGPKLERGPAYATADTARPAPVNLDDWPTYRHDPIRSGATEADVPDKLRPRWNVKIGDKLSPPTVVGDKLFVSLINEHHVVALSADDGKKLWEFAAGARVDTPPTYHRGTVLFGSADGWAYCLRAADGELVWRFRAAPQDRFIGAFGQLESAWPVHGSILVQNGVAYFAAGRSSHLDGGIWLYALDAASGKLIHEARLEGPHMDFDSFTDNVTPEQGALTDVLQGDGRYIYMRHLAFDEELKQQESSAPRIRAVGGMLDDTYFKRAPWRYGKAANWGRLLVHDDGALYLVRMFERLQCLDPTNFFTPGKEGYTLAAQPRNQWSQIRVANSPSLNPAGKPLTVEAWVKATGGNGAILARGGVNHGYALVLKGGKPRFVIRVSDKTYGVTAEKNVVGDWVHLAGVLTEDKQLQVYIDGELAASAEAPGFLVANPGQAMEVGADVGTGAGDYESPFAFTGTIDEVGIYHRALSPAEIAEHHAKPGQAATKDADLALHFSFDAGDARDESGNGNDGQVVAAEIVDGKSGNAMRFAAGGGPEWSLRVPIRVRAMVATNAPASSTGGRGGRLLFVAGPPDVVDPEDPLGAFEGRKGALLWVFSAASGEKLAEYRLASPPVFNGMAAANGRLYLCARDGRVLCMGGA